MRREPPSETAAGRAASVPEATPLGWRPRACGRLRRPRAAPPASPPTAAALLLAALFAVACEEPPPATTVDLGPPADPLPLPDLSGVDMEAAFQELLDTALLVHAAVPWEANLRVLGDHAQVGCPDLWLGYPDGEEAPEDDLGGMSWGDYCTTAGGLSFGGHAWWTTTAAAAGDPTTAEGRTEEGSRTLDADGVVSLNTDLALEVDGVATDALYRVVAESYERWTWSSEVDATVAGSSTFGPGPLQAGVRADLYLYATGGDVDTLTLRGNAYLLQDRIASRFDSLALDVELTGPRGAAPDDCQLEPRGWMGLRDENAWWYDVVFLPTEQTGVSGGPTNTPYTACDGCGTLYVRGLDVSEELGTICPDFSALWSNPDAFAVPSLDDYVLSIHEVLP